MKKEGTEDMKTREEALEYGLSFSGYVLAEMPFHDPGW